MNVTHRIFLEHIFKSFDTPAGNLSVLRDISTRFDQGKTYAITGRSGSGKSTLMHIIAGLETPTEGKLVYNDKAMDELSEKERSHILNKHIGLVFQDSYLIDQLTVAENVMLKGLIAGNNIDFCAKRADKLLSIMNLEEKSNSYPRLLSGGQQQRIALARALFNEPTFLIADEPTGNLDSKTGKEIIDWLLDLCKEWCMGLIISSHDPYVAQKMEIVYKLENGQLLTHKI